MSKETISVELDIVRYIQQKQVALNLPLSTYKDIEFILDQATIFNRKVVVQKTPKKVEEVSTSLRPTLIKARPTAVVLNLLSVLSDTSRVYLDNQGNEYCKPRGCREMLNMSYNEYVETPSGKPVPIIRDYTINTK